jgi:ribosomal protein S18 acetylase RimI-like enzyme
MQQVNLVKATLNDVSEITALAKVIWHQHYPDIITLEQINYMLEKMYSAKSLQQQLTELQHVFYFVNWDGQNVGFISVNNTTGEDWHLNKFYVLQHIAAKGIGSKAFDLLLAALKPEKMTLTVNRKNYKSINFYFKNGFKITEVKDFDIGNGYLMEDFVMTRSDN